jgi:hypothetical protein
MFLKLTTTLALILAAANANISFNDCESISFDEFLATKPSNDSVKVGPSGTYFATGNGGCKMLDFLAPGFDKQHPEAYGQFADAMVKAHQVAASHNTLFFPDGFSEAKRGVGLEDSKRDVAACGQSCDPNGGDLCPVGCGSCQYIGGFCTTPGNCNVIFGCR